MVEIPELDELDQQIVMALQVNGRASWRRIATALGVSESTITRRGQQLLSERVVAVTGVLDHLRTGIGLSVYVRLRARPGRALEVARAVAAQARPRFVTCTIGSFDVAAEVVVDSPRDVLGVIAGIEAIDDVLETESMVVTRKFSAFEEWHPAELDGHAVDVLRHAPDVTDYAHRDWVQAERLSDQDLVVADLLAADGRATYSAIAARAGMSESTVARRVESLVQRGCIRFRTVFEGFVIGYDIEHLLWLTVEPSRVEDVGDRLAKLPTTRYVSAATGQHNLILQGALRSHADLYRYMTEVVGQLPGIQSAELAIQLHTLKRAWVPIDDDGRPGVREVFRP